MRGGGQIKGGGIFPPPFSKWPSRWQKCKPPMAGRSHPLKSRTRGSNDTKWLPESVPYYRCLPPIPSWGGSGYTFSANRFGLVLIASDNKKFAGDKPRSFRGKEHGHIGNVFSSPRMVKQGFLFLSL